MDLTLKRISNSGYGVFSVLTNRLNTGPHLELYTLEHSFSTPPTYYQPKITPGTYQCRRGMHSLDHYNEGKPFETFEVTGVVGHTGILFHPGNVNADSDGCILLGKQMNSTMLMHSRDAFAEFMAAQVGTDMFILNVIA